MPSQFQVNGEREFMAVIQEFGRSARAAGRETWWVGTVVNYAPPQEFGTGRMRARPHWRPAIQMMSEGRQGGSLELAIRQSTRPIKTRMEAHRTWERWFGPDKSPAGRLAGKLRKEIQRLIVVLDIRDTDNYLGSIAYASTEAKMAMASFHQLKPDMKHTAAR